MTSPDPADTPLTVGRMSDAQQSEVRRASYRSRWDDAVLQSHEDAVNAAAPHIDRAARIDALKKAAAELARWGTDELAQGKEAGRGLVGAALLINDQIAELEGQQDG